MIFEFVGVVLLQLQIQGQLRICMGLGFLVSHLFCHGGARSELEDTVPLDVVE